MLDFIERRFEKEIRRMVVAEPEKAVTEAFPENLKPELAKVLGESGIDRLYAHQREAFEAISEGRDTLLVTRTASGKTLSFMLPILNAYAEDPFSVLLLYPTKALSRDQEGTLGKLMGRICQGNPWGTFDGDTPREERQRISGTADFAITNPDMLHNGILPNHQRRWRNFLSRLRYIVVDEVHTYRGAFGSHVANVFRRLLRVCELHGAQPTFICCSATSGSPSEHARALTGRDFQVVDRDGSPRPQRTTVFINPPMAKSHGDTLYRKGPASITIPIIREAAKRGIRCICFCRARQEVERLHRAVLDRHPDLAKRVKPYRGGLLPAERRKLERDLFDGNINVIISTNALELGIDIGDLDLCLLSGHPGTLAGFWQQSGRVGRSERDATVVYVAKDSPIDQYIVHHPEFVHETPVEKAWLNADNPYILLQHLPCAAHENPLSREETRFSGPPFEEALELLGADGTLKPFGPHFRFALRDYPSRGVNLRGMTDHNIEIYCGTEVIGELDPIGARGTLYKDAIYQHLGRRYMSMDLDLEKKLCRVEAVDVDYYTEAVWESRVEIEEVDEELRQNGHLLQFGMIHTNRQPKLYKKIRERSLENIGYGPITLDPFEYDTTGFAIRIGPDWEGPIREKDARWTGIAVYGLAYLLKRIAPVFCMGDPGDLETDVSLTPEAETWRAALFLYDSIEGGVGFAEKVFEQAPRVWDLCLDILDECECHQGCPACVPTMPPGVQEDSVDILVESNAAVACTRSLLHHLRHGELVMPEIATTNTPLESAVEPEPEDAERIKLRKRLQRANTILKRQREREH